MKRFLKYIISAAIIFPSFYGFYYLGWNEGKEWRASKDIYKALEAGFELGRIDGILESYKAFKKNGLKGVEKIKTKDGKEIYKLEY